MIANLEPERPPGKRVTPYEDTARQHDSHWTLRLAIYSPPPCGSLRVPLPHSRTVSYTPEPRPTGRLRYQEAESVLPANVRGPGAERQFSKPDASFSDRALVRQRAKPPASSSARGRKWADFDHLPCARWSFCYHLVLVRGRYERFLTRFGGTVDAKWPPPAVTLVTFPPARRVRPVGWAFLSQTARNRWSETYHCTPIVVTWLPLCCIATTYHARPGPQPRLSCYIPSTCLLPLMCLSMPSTAATGSVSTASLPPVRPSTSRVRRFTTSGAPVTGGTGDTWV